MRIILRIIFIMFIIVNLFSCTYNDSGSGDGESNPEASNDELVELSDSIPELELVFSSEDVIKNLTQKMSAPLNYSSYIESKVEDIGFYVAILNFMIRNYKQYVKDNAHNMLTGTPIEINKTENMPNTDMNFSFHKLKYELTKNGLKIYWVFYITIPDPDTEGQLTTTNRLYIKLERDPDHNGFYIASFALNNNAEGFIYFRYSTYTKTLINYENWQVDTGTAENYREYYLIDRANAHYKYLEYLIDPDSTPDTKITVIIANNDGRYIYDSTIIDNQNQEVLVFYDNNGTLGTPPGTWDELNNLEQDWLEKAPGEIDKYTPSELLPGSDSPEFSDLY